MLQSLLLDLNMIYFNIESSIGQTFTVTIKVCTVLLVLEVTTANQNSLNKRYFY